LLSQLPLWLHRPLVPLASLVCNAVTAALEDSHTHREIGLVVIDADPAGLGTPAGVGQLRSLCSVARRHRVAMVALVGGGYGTLMQEDERQRRLRLYTNMWLHVRGAGSATDITDYVPASSSAEIEINVFCADRVGHARVRAHAPALALQIRGLRSNAL
jgi:hypothetical protein